MVNVQDVADKGSEQDQDVREMMAIEEKMKKILELNSETSGESDRIVSTVATNRTN